MEVPHTLDGYPPPAPPPTKKMDIFKAEDYKLVDYKAAQAPEKLTTDYEDLIQYLTASLGSDLAKVRSVFAWLSSQNVLSTQFPKVVKENTPQAFLKRIKYDRTLYSDFFALLCRKAGVPCVIIEGSSKGAGYEIGQHELKVTNRWNAVHVQGAWRLVNVPWALVKTDGLEEDKTWIVVEQCGEACLPRAESKKEVLQDMDEFWFLTDPEDFNCFCFARERRWQLMPEPWTAEVYHGMPKFAQDYFTSDWELLSEYKSVLKADKGRCQIRFAHPANVGSACLLYNLYFCPALSKNELPNDVKVDRYVLEDSKLGEKALITRLPVEGVYRVEVAGQLGEMRTVLGEFRIDCVNVKHMPARFPISNTPIGPTEEARKMVEEFSHGDGVVVARQGEKVNMNFNFKNKGGRNIRVHPVLVHNNMRPDELSKYVRCNETKDDVNVSVTVPKTGNDAEYGLCIDVIETGEKENGEKEEIEHLQLINYLITADSTLTFPDQQEALKARQELLASMKGFNIDRLIKTVARASKTGILDARTESKVNRMLVQLNKMKGEKLKDLCEAMKGTDPRALESALVEYEEFGSPETKVIERAKAVLDLLRALKDDDDVMRLEEALRRVKELNADVTGIMHKADNRLVFHYEKSLCEVCNKRSLEELESFLHSAHKTCVASHLHVKPMYENAQRLRDHLKEIKRVTQEVGKLGARDLNALSSARKGPPHPHLHSVMMATFILLGEREKELWEWEAIQKLLERRKETGVVRAMVELNVDHVTQQQVDLAESHVSACQLEVVRSEIGPNAGLFLQWVLLTVEEKRTRNVKYNSSDIFNPDTLPFTQPTKWTPQPDTQPVVTVALEEGCQEYNEVMDNLTRTLESTKVTVTTIERIQNPFLYRQYEAKKQQMGSLGNSSERTLWHGTAQDAIVNINMYGFNRRYCGKNATVYGAGVYFAVRSSYSTNTTYSPADKDGNRYIYQCKVLVGHAVKGHEKMRYLPPREGALNYDSATDNTQNPEMFVIFNDIQAYPEYLITFK